MTSGGHHYLQDLITGATLSKEMFHELEQTVQCVACYCADSLFDNTVSLGECKPFRFRT